MKADSITRHHADGAVRGAIRWPSAIALCQSVSRSITAPRALSKCTAARLAKRWQICPTGRNDEQRVPLVYSTQRQIVSPERASTSSNALRGIEYCKYCFGTYLFALSFGIGLLELCLAQNGPLIRFNRNLLTLRNTDVPSFLIRTHLAADITSPPFISHYANGYKRPNPWKHHTLRGPVWMGHERKHYKCSRWCGTFANNDTFSGTWPSHVASGISTCFSQSGHCLPTGIVPLKGKKTNCNAIGS